MAKLATESVIARHRAKDDHGEVYTVLEIQRFVDAGTAENPHHIVKGIKRLALDDGREVVEVDPEKFKIVATQQIIRKVS